MRHFTSQIEQFCTFVLDDSVSLTDPLFVRIFEALVITMGANLSELTSSEERALADFIGWVRRCLDEARQGTIPTELVFVYHNLNEGHSMAVIWTDSKGKLVAPANQLRDRSQAALLQKSNGTVLDLHRLTNR